MAYQNGVDELFYNQTGTTPPRTGKGLDVATSALQLGSTILANKANKPEFSQYVKTKCGNKPLFNRKKRKKFETCKEGALREYASLGQGSGSVPPPPPPSDSYYPDTTGTGSTGGGGKANNKTLLYVGIGVGVVILGFVAYKMLK